MKKKFQFMIIISFIFILSNCSRSEKFTIDYKNNVKIVKNFKPQKNISVKLNKIISISNLDSTILIDPWMFNIDNYDNIYIFDFSDYLIKKFDQKGVFIKSFGKKGMGPGEYSQFSSFFIYNNNIFVLDNDQKIMIKYALNGSFIENIKLDSKIPYNIIEIDQNYVFGSNFGYIKFEKGFIQSMDLGVYNKDFRFVNTIEHFEIKFNPNKPTNANPLNTFYSYSTIDQKIYMAQNSYNSYKILVYNMAGKVIKEIKKSYKNILFSTEEYKTAKSTINNLSNITTDENSIKYKKSINGIFFDGKNRLWVCTSKEVNEKIIKFDLFEKDILLGSFDLDIPIKFDFNITFDMKFHNNKIYILNNENAFLNVYDYKIIENNNQ